MGEAVRLLILLQGMEGTVALSCPGAAWAGVQATVARGCPRLALPLLLLNFLRGHWLGAPHFCGIQTSPSLDWPNPRLCTLAAWRILAFWLFRRALQSQVVASGSRRVSRSTHTKQTPRSSGPSPSAICCVSPLQPSFIWAHGTATMPERSESALGAARVRLL